MRTLCLAALGLVLAAPAAQATPRPVRPAVRHAVTRLGHLRAFRLYWLGFHWNGMTLTLVDTTVPTMIDLTYGDCAADQLEVMALPCHHVVDVEESPPIPGEISTQGRCTYSGTVRGATVARFPVNPRTLRVFTPQATIYVSGSSLRAELDAVRALRGLNVRLAAGAAFPHRDVAKALGHCRAPAKATRPLTPKQAYEQKMKRSFSIETASRLSLSDWARWAKPLAGVRMFLNGVGTFPLLLRDEATRISRIRPPPAAVADLHVRLIRELRAYAADVDVSIRLVRAGAWKNARKWDSTAKRLDAQFARDAGVIAATARAFRKRGYAIFVKPHD